MYRQGLEAGRKRDYRRAVELLTEVVSRTERFPHAILYLGRAWHAAGDYPRAVQVLRFYLKAVPDSGPGRFFLARTYLALEMHEPAVRLLRWVADRDPSFEPAHSLLGMALLKLRRSAQAVAALERAVQLSPDNPRVYNAYLNALLVRGMRLARSGRLEEARQIFEFLLRERPGSLLPHVYLGRIHREAGRSDQALAHYSAATELAPDDPVLPLLKAVAAMGAGKAEAASEELDKVTDLLGKGVSLPRNPEVLAKLLAVNLFQAGRFHDTVRYGRLALRADYHDADLHAVMAQSYLTLGDPQRARNHYQRAIRYGKEAVEHHYGLAIALFELGDYEALEKATLRIDRLSPGNPHGQYFRVLALSETGEADVELVSALQESIRRSGPDARLMTAMARAYIQTGLPDLAVGWLDRTLKIDPDDGRALSLRVAALSRMDRPAALRQAYRKYLGRFPEDSDTRRQFADLLMDQDRYKEAAVQFRSLLPLHPASRNLRKTLAHCCLMSEGYGEAAVLYRELLREKPAELPTLRALVLCLDRTGAGAEAVALLEKAARHFRDHRDILLPLGVLYLKQDDPRRAQQVFRAVIAEDPRNWRAHHNLARAYRRSGQADMAERFFENARRYRGSEPPGTR